MSHEFVYIIGVVVCCIAVAGALIAAIVLRLAKVRLNRQFDAEYGKRRH